MRIAILLHIYQPPTQFPEVLKAISEKSYVRIIRLLKKYPEARLTLNIPAALTEQWKEHGYNRLITDLTNLVREGQVELTGSAAYHGLLFKLPEAEIIRQIKLNEEANRRFFGDLWSPRGFFPPEMAVNERVLKAIETCGYEWVVLEFSNFQFPISNEHIFTRKGGGLKILPRDKRLSLGVAFGRIRSVKEFFDKWKMINAKWKILALDGETFGWHRPEQLELLEEIFKTVETQHAASLQLATISELVRQLPAGPEIGVGRTSWGERREKDSQVFYPRWEDPGNVIHQLQWQLTNLAIETVRNSKHKIDDKSEIRSTKSETIPNYQNSNDQNSFENLKIRILNLFRISNLGFRISGRGKDKLTAKQKQWLKARYLLDRALHSDQYFWAEGKNVWHPAMVERGARMLKDVVLTVPDSTSKDRKHTKELYDRIVETGRNLYGEVLKA